MSTEFYVYGAHLMRRQIQTGLNLSGSTSTATVEPEIPFETDICDPNFVTDVLGFRASKILETIGSE